MGNEKGQKKSLLTIFLKQNQVPKPFFLKSINLCTYYPTTPKVGNVFQIKKINKRRVFFSEAIPSNGVRGLFLGAGEDLK
jgi:hypothetical protein